MPSTDGTSWYQLASVIFTILSSAFCAAFYLGRKVEGMRWEMKLNRIDLAMLFRHFNLEQPSRALENERRGNKHTILGEG